MEQKQTKKKLEALMKRIESRMEQYEKFPVVLKDRILKTVILSFLILFLGIHMGKGLGEGGYIFWSAVLSLFCVYKAYSLFALAEKKDYETVEGVVFRIQGRYRFGKVYKVHVRQADGRCTTLLIDKDRRCQVGKRYRFYFRRTKEAVLSGMDGLDAVLNADSFYGFEELI